MLSNKQFVTEHGTLISLLAFILKNCIEKPHCKVCTLCLTYLALLLSVDIQDSNQPHHSRVQLTELP